jgi:hypothetical protein
VPGDFLQNFKGALQTDGYSVYDAFDKPGEITLLACMAHARRKFDQAQDSDRTRAEQALKLFQPLYETEREAKLANLTGG